MRSIKNIINAEYAPIQDLITYSPLPSRTLQHIDPFLFLNHHGPQVYKPNNNGLPFGPHPHRGMETVTFILEGDIAHKDSGGNESVITSGGIQWMTAGRGLIHAETSSDVFKRNGGKLEILQLWVNLPAKLKMTEPKYLGFNKDQIPEIKLDNDKVLVRVISGDWDNVKGAFNSSTGININMIYFSPEGKIEISVPVDENIFFYVIRGSLEVNNKNIQALQLVNFNNDNEQLDIQSKDNSIVLFGHAKPFNEPVVAQGPFVMNSEEEIMQAYNDYRTGKFGEWVFE